MRTHTSECANPQSVQVISLSPAVHIWQSLGTEEASFISSLGTGTFSGYWPAARRGVTPLPIAIAVIAALCVPGRAVRVEKCWHSGQYELKSVGIPVRSGQYELKSVGIPVRSVRRRAFAAGISSPGTVLRLRGRGGDSSLLGVTEEVGIVPSNVGEDQAAEARGPALRFSFRELAQRRKREAAARENEQAQRDGTNSEKYSLEWSLHGH